MLQVLQGGFSLMLRHRLHCSIVRGPKHGCCSTDGDETCEPSPIPDMGADDHEVGITSPGSWASPPQEGI